MDKTFEARGAVPYRFDVACDSPDIPKVTVVLTRGTPVTVAITAAKGDRIPEGVVAWKLKTLAPKKSTAATTTSRAATRDRQAGRQVVGQPVGVPDYRPSPGGAACAGTVRVPCRAGLPVVGRDLSLRLS
ncbi:hypothetical protein AB0D29_32925 [Streptomyces sp. NPDC048424]|uniref:hypothetical protein n=1 Tax=Streptomyces sp. NPDC048424 TaxID=3155265 RepID=UPI00343FDE90